MDASDFVSDISGVDASGNVLGTTTDFNPTTGVSTTSPLGSTSGTSGGNGNLDNNSLYIALAGDATKVGAAFIGANAASKLAKANPASVSTLILVAGGVAALILVVILVKK